MGGDLFDCDMPIGVSLVLCIVSWLACDSRLSWLIAVRNWGDCSPARHREFWTSTFVFRLDQGRQEGSGYPSRMQNTAIFRVGHASLTCQMTFIRLSHRSRCSILHTSEPWPILNFSSLNARIDAFRPITSSGWPESTARHRCSHPDRHKLRPRAARQRRTRTHGLRSANPGRLDPREFR